MDWNIVCNRLYVDAIFGKCTKQAAWGLVAVSAQTDYSSVYRLRMYSNYVMAKRVNFQNLFDNFKGRVTIRRSLR